MNDKKMTWEEAVQWLRNQPNMEELVKDAFYDDPLSESAKRYHHSTEWLAVQELLSGIPKKKVLDIGAGRGISSYSFAIDGWDVTALEPDPSEIVGAGAIRALAEESGINIKVVEKWGEKIPFSDNSFDVVYCRAALHHAKNLDGLCKEVFRILKPKGIFLATREHVISKKEDLHKFLEIHPLQHLYGGENAYLLSEYCGAMKKAGFNIKKLLNPAESNINLYPETSENAKNRISKKYHIPKYMVSDGILKISAALSNSPGRLYSFLARK